MRNKVIVVMVMVKDHGSSRGNTRKPEPNQKAPATPQKFKDIPNYKFESLAPTRLRVKPGLFSRGRARQSRHPRPMTLTPRC